MALTAEQRIERCHIDLMKHMSFVAYSSILMLGKAEVKDSIPTACTDGKNVYYGRKFVDSLTDPELRGVILHEAKHKMYRHLLTWKHLNKQNPRKANRACDYVINLEIKDEGKQTGDFITLPDGCLLDEKYRGLNSGEVFALLDDMDSDKDRGMGQFDEHDWDNADSMTEAEKEELAKEIDQAIRQGAILAGKVGGNLNRSFDELMSAKVNWKDALQEFVSAVCQGKDDTTWRKPSRRWLQHDIYMPSTISESVGRVVVAIDTSGSIYGSVLNRFISEVASIMDSVNPEMVDLLYWDTNVAGHEVYAQGEAHKMTSSTKPKGGGGTTVGCVNKYIRDNKLDPVCIIILTDGYVESDWGGTFNAPVLWALVGNNTTAPTGSTIHVE